MRGEANIRNRYIGRRATEYEARRAGKPEWQAEHEALHAYLADLPAGSSVVDVPVGTGRFARIYSGLDLIAIGFDTSPDMVSLAAAAGVPSVARSIFDLTSPAADDFADAAVCFRFLNWITADEMSRAIGVLSNIARVKVVLSIRLGEPTEEDNSPQRAVDFWGAVGAAGLRFSREAVIDGKGYSVFELVKGAQ